MRKLASLFVVVLALLLSACGSDEFHGRYTDPEGLTSYEFAPDGKVTIVTQSAETTTNYHYNAKSQTLTLTENGAQPAQTIQVTDNGSLEVGNTLFARALDTSMLIDSTWIGHQGEYTFTLTFSQSDNGLETFSELVTYYDDDKTYAYQTDDSITVLRGNQLHLDKTVYIVSDVTDTSLKISIGNQSMVIHKHPKGTAIEFREGYSDIDSE
jgi:hypothetical protein